MNRLTLQLNGTLVNFSYTFPCASQIASDKDDLLQAKSINYEYNDRKKSLLHGELFRVSVELQEEKSTVLGFGSSES